MSKDIELGVPICETQTWSDSMSEVRRDALIVAAILFLLIGLFWRVAFYIGVFVFPLESVVDTLTLLVLVCGTALLVWMFIRSYLGTGIVGKSLRLTKNHPWFTDDGEGIPAVGFLDVEGVKWLAKGDRIEMHEVGLFGKFMLKVRNGSDTLSIVSPRWLGTVRTARLAMNSLNAAAAVAEAEARSGEDPSLIGARQREDSGESLLERSWDSTTPGVISDDVRSGIQQILDSRGSESNGGESE